METPSFTIGEYQVIRHIAQGGMGALYEVEDDNGHRRAMKLAAVDKAAEKRFERIYAAISPLSHPGLCAMHRFGRTDDGRAYLLMDLVDAVPAQVFAKSLGKPGTAHRTALVVTAMIQLAKTLGYLHEHQVIHRDVKSANVLIGADATTHLVDFGSALLPGAQIQAGRFVGTYTYAPPEQIRGEPVDARSDLYSMGVLFYRMLAGKRPFHAENGQALAQMHLHAAPPALSTRVTTLSPALCDVVHALLEKDPADRPANTAALLDRLNPI